ncbi:CGNR zinc finger domain-containing protein [Nonomuraea sp. NPDC003709]|uniref:CGNR zinc finger domain-containing protein n=1 Tax=Nonomuraea sp. NPDC003709 TaxID=3154450 RepID=UPI0033B3FCD9
MVTFASKARSPWQDAHFIGGHPVLDLTNTVFDRTHPAEDGELLKAPSDVLTWCASAGLFEEVPSLTEASASGLVPEVQTVREQAWAVFSAVAHGEAVPAEPFGALLERAGTGVRAEQVQQIDAALDRFTVDWTASGAIPAALSLLVVQALFTLPRDRIRACGRCGWLFLDSSRGGRRRWCSMNICGNREKARRHRQGRTHH